MGTNVSDEGQLIDKHPQGSALLSLDGADFRELFLAGSGWLELHHQSVNALNVFPVPDGDTGTNMLLTMRSALEEINTVHTTAASAVVQAAAHGALMGARGNSGVILSQILRGIAHGLSGEDMVDAAELIHAFRDGTTTAYRGVVRPVEGTILTVIREVADALEQRAALRDLRDFFQVAVDVAAESVRKTPTLLAVLAEAGVVDAGGQGLFLILEGMHRCLNGMTVGAEVSPSPLLEVVQHAEMPSGEYGYDVQCLVLGTDLNVEQIRDEILGMGDSVLVVGDSRTVKVHVHTDQPGKPLDYCASMGQIDRIIIENMQLQYEQFVDGAGATSGLGLPEADPNGPSPAFLVGPSTALGPIGTVVVAAGDGMAQVFRSLGVHAIVRGGQTMNPSTEDLLTAIDGLAVDDVIVLPNNKNIILAARQAKDLSSKSVRVVASKSMPQGISALLVLSQQSDLDKNALQMEAALAAVQTGEVTTAVRDVRLGGVEVAEGDYIGLKDGELVVQGETAEGVVRALLDQMATEDAEIITLYRGEPITMDRAAELEAELREQYPEQEVELVDGGQPHYHFLFSVE